MVLRLGCRQHGGEEEGKGREGMKGEVRNDEKRWMIVMLSIMAK